jgi:hypothetical protein
MTTLAPTAEETVLGPIVGWRVWRILPFKTLNGQNTYRLAAAGTQGLPKVWEPRKANTAVCSQFETTHEAPWPDCDCGIYAFADEEAARKLLSHFLGTINGDGAAGWACGRVSLWGRMVECEKGWRGQCAYPYDITVYAKPAIVEALRSTYAVDVTQGPSLMTLRAVENKPGSLDKSQWLPLADTQRMPVVVDALRAVLARPGRLTAKSYDLVQELKDDFAHVDICAVSRALYVAHLAGEVVKIKGGWWSLPEHREHLPNGQIVGDRLLESDGPVLDGLTRAAVNSNDGSANIREIMAAMGEDVSDRKRKAQLVQALIRHEYRGNAVAEGGYRGILKRWAVA